MKSLTFEEWVNHWGEDRLNETIAHSQKCYKRMWEQERDRGALWQYPAWELCLGSHWQESLDDWHARWLRCGGVLCEGRMIAVKWDGIWTRLSETFEDALGKPYPPYARSSCARWDEIDQDEAIVTGAISEEDYDAYMAQFPVEPLIGKDGNPLSREFLIEILAELSESIHQKGGPPPNATRRERVEHRRLQQQRQFEQMTKEYEERCRQQEMERVERDSVFRLLERVEFFLKSESAELDPPDAEWLRESLEKLTATSYFERYPNWRARTWVACANVHQLGQDLESELACLSHALSINAKLPIKRRIKKLQNELGRR